jgi:A/G-specific adenine glycosylase
MKAWAGLGYYSRARNLQKAARALLELGRYPGSAAEWKTLPGVGPYTAGAVASLALGRGEPIVDGNVVRVFSRLRGLEFLPGDGAGASEAYWELARVWANGGANGADAPEPVNEALMELGALVCAPAAPKCGECPLAPMCRARAEGRQGDLPPARKREKIEAVSGAAVRARRGGEVLLERRGEPRRSGTFLAGHEMFPLFLGAEAEAWQAAFRRRFPGLRLENARAAGRVTHSIMSKRYDLEIWDCEVSAPRGSDSARIWTNAGDVEERLTNSLARKIWRAGGKQ